MAGPGSERVVAQHVVNRPQTVRETDLLPFAHMARRVADRQFQKAGLRATRHGRDFNFHAETLASKREFLEDWRPKGFIASLDIS